MFVKHIRGKIYLSLSGTKIFIQYFNIFVFIVMNPVDTTTAPHPLATPSPPTDKCTRHPPASHVATCQATCPTTVRQRSPPLMGPAMIVPSRPGPASTSLCRGSKQPPATTNRWPRGRTRCPPHPEVVRVLMYKDAWKRQGQ